MDGKNWHWDAIEEFPNPPSLKQGPGEVVVYNKFNCTQDIASYPCKYANSWPEKDLVTLSNIPIYAESAVMIFW